MDRQYVGIDFHRRRSVIVRLSGSGERLGLHRIVNDPFELAGGDRVVRRSSAGGDRSNVWLVLGGRSVAGTRRGRASREPAGVELGRPTRRRTT